MLIFINTTQLYSNLVIHIYKITTYLCLVLVVLVSPKISRVRLALLHISFPLLITITLSHTIHSQLGKHFPFIDLGKQRRTNTWSLKQRVSSARWKQAFPDFPSLVKRQVGRGNIQSLDRNTNYSY